MKDRLFIISMAILILFCFASCSDSEPDVASSKAYKISDFNTIKLEMIGTVYYEQGDSVYLNVSGSSGLIEDLKVSDKKGNLSIKMKKDNQFTVNRKGLEIRIGSPSLSDITINGIGSFNIEKSFKSDEVTINHNGIGKINIADCQVGVFNLNSTAMGAINVKGKATETIIHSQGVGQIDCAELKSQNTKVVSSGVGNISVYAQNSIDISMTGVGNVNYYGNPNVVKSDVSGLGKVTNKGL